MRRLALVCATAVTGLAVVGGVPGAAVATSPPPSWTEQRTLDCDGTIVETSLTPAGFGTPYHVVGSPDVIIPKHVVGTPPGKPPVVSIDVKGFDPDGPNAVHCTYTDPNHVFVDLRGIRV